MEAGAEDGSIGAEFEVDLLCLLLSPLCSTQSCRTKVIPYHDDGIAFSASGAIWSTNLNRKIGKRAARSLIFVGNGIIMMAFILRCVDGWL
jgi:hypothetical protein